VNGDSSRGRGAWHGADTRGRRRAPRRFGGWRDGRRAMGTYSRMVSNLPVKISDISLIGNHCSYYYIHTCIHKENL